MDGAEGDINGLVPGTATGSVLPGIGYVDPLTGPGNDTFDDPTVWVPSPSDLVFPGISGTTYYVSNNRGSGVIEYYAYAPSMNLAMFDPNDYLVGRIWLDDLDNGPEEMFILGNIVPFRDSYIPEPSSIMLCLAGMAAWRRRRRKV